MITNSTSGDIIDHWFMPGAFPPPFVSGMNVHSDRLIFIFRTKLFQIRYIVLDFGQVIFKDDDIKQSNA
jgi:hypothetical protein